MTMTLTVGDPILEATAQLSEIGLAELSENGSLQTRVDRKYLLPAGIAGELVSGMTAHARVLVVDRRRESHYRSLYFDTAAYDSYFSTAFRRRRRFKVRTRSYLDTGERMLEVKTRTGRGVTVKWRAVHSGGAEGLLDAQDQRFVAETLREAGVGVGADGLAAHARDAAAGALALDSLSPVVAIDYRRMTLSLTEPTARVTFDRGLVWRSAAGHGPDDEALPACDTGAGGRVEFGDDRPSRGVELADAVIVETKTERGPCAADHALWRQGYRPVSLSKFGTGMALTRPALPANRWHRLLARELRPRCVPVGPTTGG